MKDSRGRMNLHNNRAGRRVSGGGGILGGSVSGNRRRVLRGLVCWGILRVPGKRLICQTCYCSSSGFPCVGVRLIY